MLNETPFAYTFNTEEFAESQTFSEELVSSFAEFKNRLTEGTALSLQRTSFEAHPIYKTPDQAYLTKGDLRRHKKPFDEELMNSPSHWVLKTSGTSGPPMTVTYSSQFYFINLLQVILRTAWIHGRDRLTDRRLPTIFVTDNVSYTRTLYQDPSGLSGNLFVLPLLSTAPNALQATIAEIRTLGPVILSTKPNILRILVEYLEQKAESLQIELVVSSGAHLEFDTREHAQRMLDCPVVSSYNTSELGFIAAECPRGVLHVDSSLHQIEILAENSRVCVSGEGEILASCLANECMPLWRYKTGDRGIVCHGTCECGLSGVIIQQLTGRTVPVFDIGRGENFSPTRWMKFFENFSEAEEFQVIQVCERKFLVRVQLSQNVNSLAQLTTRLDTFFKPTINNAEFNYESTVFSDKHARFIPRSI